jgi:hypothetical protein
MNQFLIGFAIAAIAAAGLFAWQERQHRRMGAVIAQVQADALETVTEAHGAIVTLLSEAQHRQDAQILEILNRFLSRNATEHVMTQMIGDEVKVDQDSEPDPDAAIDAAAVREHLQSLAERARQAADAVVATG